MLADSISVSIPLSQVTHGRPRGLLQSPPWWSKRRSGVYGNPASDTNMPQDQRNAELGGQTVMVRALGATYG